MRYPDLPVLLSSRDDLEDAVVLPGVVVLITENDEVPDIPIEF